MLLNSRATIGQGARRRCATCNSPINVKPTGRTRKFCSPTCRDIARREANFRDSQRDPAVGAAMPRNPEKLQQIQQFAKALWLIEGRSLSRRLSPSASVAMPVPSLPRNRPNAPH